MADWLKVLIGVFAGLIAGLIAEPLKAWINGRMKERAIRDALYPVMADIYGFAASGDNRELRDQYPMAFPDANLDVFDHYYSTEKAAFFRLREAQFISTFFFLARKWFAPANDDPVEQDNLRRTLMGTIQTAIASGALDSKRFKKLISKGSSWRTGGNA